MRISDWSSDVCSSDLVVNHRPLRREHGVDREEVLLATRDIVLLIDRAYRAFGHAQGAVDAAFRVDDEEIRALVETVHQANLDAGGVLADGESFGYAVGHGEPVVTGHPCSRPAQHQSE